MCYIPNTIILTSQLVDSSDGDKNVYGQKIVVYGRDLRAGGVERWLIGDIIHEHMVFRWRGGKIESVSAENTNEILPVLRQFVAWFKPGVNVRHNVQVQEKFVFRGFLIRNRSMSYL